MLTYNAISEATVINVYNKWDFFISCVIYIIYKQYILKNLTLTLSALNITMPFMLNLTVVFYFKQCSVYQVSEAYNHFPNVSF